MLIELKKLGLVPGTSKTGYGPFHMKTEKMTSFEINYPWIWGAWPECTRTEVSKIIRNVNADPPFHTEGKQLSSMKIMSCLVQPSLSIKNHSTFKLHFFGEISNWQNYWHERPWKSKGLFFYHSCCLSRIQKNNTNSLSFKKKKNQSVPKGHTKNWMLKLSVILHGCYFHDGRHFRTTINAGSSL